MPVLFKSTTRQSTDGPRVQPRYFGSLTRIKRLRSSMKIVSSGPNCSACRRAYGPGKLGETGQRIFAERETQEWQRRGPATRARRFVQTKQSFVRRTKHQEIATIPLVPNPALPMEILIKIFTHLHRFFALSEGHDQTFFYAADASELYFAAAMEVFFDESSES